MAYNKQKKSQYDDDVIIERPYYDDEKEQEELEKVPVEYLGHLRKRKIFRLERFVFWLVFWILVLGIGPGIQGQKINARSGEVKIYYTYTWGKWTYESFPRSTTFTEWYLSMAPEPHDEHWVDFGTVYPALFGFIRAPWGRNLGWVIPGNLVERMEALDGKFPAGTVMKIPRILNSVNNAQEWNTIVIPLCEGTVDDAYTWWNENEDRFQVWSRQVWGTPMPSALIQESQEYIDKMRETDENFIPLFTESP